MILTKEFYLIEYKMMRASTASDQELMAKLLKTSHQAITRVFEHLMLPSQHVTQWLNLDQSHLF